MSIAGSASFVHSKFGSEDKLELVILEARKLVHYWRKDTDPKSLLRRGQVISHQASSSGSIIQSHLGQFNHNRLEVLVLEDRNLVHYFLDNSNLDKAWQKGGIVSSKATGPAGFIQSDFVQKDGRPGNFEAVVLEGNNLVHYYRNNSDPALEWQRTETISTCAVGPASIIQSTLGNVHGNFEVVVLESCDLIEPCYLTHYYRDNSPDSNYPWRRTAVIDFSATGPASLIQSSHRIEPNAPGNFELVVLEGHNLVHYWRDNSAPKRPWHRTGVIDTRVNASAYLNELDTKVIQEKGNLEVIIPDGHKLVRWWCNNTDFTHRWNKGETMYINATA